jgi:hypothetical protein
MVGTHEQICQRHHLLEYEHQLCQIREWKASLFCKWAAAAMWSKQRQMSSASAQVRIDSICELKKPIEALLLRNLS